MDTKDVAGVAGLPEASNINECDAREAPKQPAKGRRNPAKCRTSALRKTRSMLKKAAMAEPGDTPERCGYHNMLEQTENLTKPCDWPHRDRHLMANLQQQQQRLASLKSEPPCAT